MFFIVAENLVHAMTLIGPFEHWEMANDYAKDNLAGVHLWRIAKAVPPK